MAVNLKLGVNSRNTSRVERPGSLRRRRSTQRYEEPLFQPKFEWLENPEAHILRVELPGFKKEHVSIQIDLYRNLTVRGERPREETELTGELKPRLQFRRVFNLPQNADTSSLTASFHNEILYVPALKLIPTSANTSIAITEQEKAEVVKLSELGQRSIQITEQENRKYDKPASNVADQGSKLDQTPVGDGAEVKQKETQLESKKSPETTTGSGISPDKPGSVKSEKDETVKPSELGQKSIEITEQNNRKNEESASNVADQGIKLDQSPVGDSAEASVVKQKETQLDSKKSEETITGSEISQDKPELVKSEQEEDERVKTSEFGQKSTEITEQDNRQNDKLASNVADQGINSDQPPLNVVKEKETQLDRKKSEETTNGSGISQDKPESVKSEQEKDEVVKPSALGQKSIEINEQDKRKNDKSASNVADQTPLDEIKEKEKETQFDGKKFEELAKETTGSGISPDKPESVKSEQEKADVVKPSELGLNPKEKEMVQQPPEQTKIDPSLPAEESLPPPPEKEKEKEKSEAAEMQDVKEKEYGSGAADEKPKLENREMKEEKPNSDVNESEITEVGKESPGPPCVFLSKMPRQRMLVVSAIVVLYVVLFIIRRFRSADD